MSRAVHEALYPDGCPGGEECDRSKRCQLKAIDRALIAEWNGTGANPPGVGGLERRPHVHAPVYFGTPAEHNQKLLEAATRALIQWVERNGNSPRRATIRNALYLVEITAQDTEGNKR